MDYGHDLRFGVFIAPDAAHPDAVVATAREADVLGLDSVSVQDHPYQPSYLDTWTLLTHLAAVTERVSVFPNVANLPLRPPAVLARSVATLDVLSGGRAELGLGAGAFWDAIAAMDGPRRTPGEAVDALAEAIAVIRALWTPGRTPRLEGGAYGLHGAKSGPFPVHPVGIWIGAYKPRMLRLVGRLADGWLPSLGYVDVGDLPALNAVIDEAALEAGREPGDVRRLLNVSPDRLAGGPDAWVEQLAGLALDEGVSHVILAIDPGDLRSVAVWAQEVAPAVRELVEAERISGPIAPTSPSSPALSPTVSTPPPPPGDGDHLVAIHDHLRAELRQLQDLVEQVARGHADAGRVRHEINRLTLRQNDWTLGTYCESYCRLVATHHTIEDQSMYPRLRHAEPRLGPALDRMVEEHHAVHGHLEAVDRALVALVAAPDEDRAAGVAGVRAAVDDLATVLLDHLTYEEGELVEPLNRLGFGI